MYNYVQDRNNILCGGGAGAWRPGPEAPGGLDWTRRRRPPGKLSNPGDTVGLVTCPLWQ